MRSEQSRVFALGVVFIVISLLGAIGCIATPYLLPPPAQQDLYAISGAVTQTVTFKQYRKSAWINIPMRTDGGEFTEARVFDVNELSPPETPQNLRMIPIGTPLTIWVSRRNQVAVGGWRAWQLRAGDRMLLSFDQALQAKRAHDYRGWWMLLILFLVGVAIVCLKWHEIQPVENR